MAPELRGYRVDRIARVKAAIAAGRRCILLVARTGSDKTVVAAATLHARATRSNLVEHPPAAIVFVDEAHHVRARTWMRILQAYPDAIVIGLTATPCGADGRGLRNAFELLIEGPTVQEPIGLSWLVPTKVYAPSVPDLKGMRIERWLRRRQACQTYEHGPPGRGYRGALAPAHRTAPNRGVRNRRRTPARSGSQISGARTGAAYN
jgi:superfamily II DNA or RNA helicase